MLLKNAGNAFAKSRRDNKKNKQLKDELQKHTHPVHFAKELTTQQTCAGMAQMRL